MIKVCWSGVLNLFKKKNRLSDEKTVQYPILLRFQGTNIEMAVPAKQNLIVIQIA